MHVAMEDPGRETSLSHGIAVAQLVRVPLRGPGGEPDGRELGRGRGGRQDHGALRRGGRRQQHQRDAREVALDPAQPAVAATLEWGSGLMAPKPVLDAAAKTPQSCPTMPRTKEEGFHTCVGSGG